MNDAGRYRKLYPRLWRDPRFQALSKSARELALYLLTGPQTNQIGLFHLSVATAAEDLGTGKETARKCLADVSKAFGWRFDSEQRVFYIPSWWRFNAPQNPNTLKGNLKDLNEVPASPLVEAFIGNTRTLPETLRSTFHECCGKRLAKPSANQEQEQEQETTTPQEPSLSATWQAMGGPREVETHRGHLHGFCAFKCLTELKVQEFARDLPRGLDDPTNFNRALEWAEQVRDTWGEKPKLEVKWFDFWEARWAQRAANMRSGAADRALADATRAHLDKVRAMEAMS